VSHEAVNETLDDGALRLAEANLVVAASRVRKVSAELVLLINCDVILKRDIAHVDVLISPLVEETLLELRNHCHLPYENTKPKRQIKKQLVKTTSLGKHELC